MHVKRGGNEVVRVSSLGARAQGRVYEALSY
jgi:hypothetical protein